MHATLKGLDIEPNSSERLLEDGWCILGSFLDLWDFPLLLLVLSPHLLVFRILNIALIHPLLGAVHWLHAHGIWNETVKFSQSFFHGS
jgi:hypothetical protein